MFNDFSSFKAKYSGKNFDKAFDVFFPLLMNTKLISGWIVACEFIELNFPNKGPFKTYFRSEGEGVGLTKTNTHYKNRHFPYIKSEQGEGGGQNRPQMSERTI